MKTRGGDVKFGAGCEVRMVPVNAYTSEVWERSKLGIVLAEPDPRYFKYRRTTMADGSGNFEFKNVPAGSYYLSCTITWQVPGVYALRSTGGTGMAKAEVGEGETVRVLVTAP